MRAADRDHLAGWIVDLRHNRGGNMWPMVAGLGPLLGEGRAGAFVDPDGGATWWGYQDNASIYNGDRLVTVASPYRLRKAHPRVAVSSARSPSHANAARTAVRRPPATR